MKRLFLLLMTVGLITSACEIFGGFDDSGNIEQPEEIDGRNNIIYYTSTDGEIVTPHQVALGANIVSNSYANGQGVIVFDAPLRILKDSTFLKCTTLKSIVLPSELTEIGNKAFHECSDLTSVTIPNSVTEIKVYAFSLCSSLTAFYGESTSEDYRCLVIDGALKAFAPAGLTEYTIPDGVTEIGDTAFYKCNDLTSVTIPNSVTEIGGQSFSQCGSLESVTIPNSVTKIGGGAFYNCHSIKSVTIPDSVTSIGYAIFGSCNSLEYFYGKFASADNRCLIVNGRLNSYAAGAKLTSYTISNDITYIDRNAFTDSDKLKTIYIPESVTSINYRAFYHCSRLVEVVCKGSTPPSGGSEMFDYNSSDRKIYVPSNSAEAYKSAEYWKEYADDIVPYSEEAGTITYTSSDGKIVKPYATNVFGAQIVSNTYKNGQGVIVFDRAVTQIGNNAFRDCASLETITIPDSVKKIGNTAFCDCTSLKSVIIPDGVTSIGEATFSGCSSLISATIPNSVTEIGTKLFYHCSSLKSVVIGNSVNSIEAGTFAYCTSLTSVTIPDSVTEIKTIAFDSCSSLTAFYGKFASEDNRCLVVNGALNAFAPAGLTEYTIPDSVTSIGEGAFLNCSSLTSVTIPDSITSIGSYAFRECRSLTSATIPDSVTEIGGGAFDDCTSLKSVIIPDGVTKIEDGVFRNCSSLTNITIPDSVTSIGQHTFMDCTSLKSVTIGNSVTKIGWSAFVDCSSLIEVYCKPTTPPMGESNMFNGNAADRKIFVPRESVEAYKAAQYWKNYASYIEGYDF